MIARKGDGVLVIRVTHDYVIGQPRTERTDCSFGVVGSATRDGMVKTFQSIGWGDDLLSESAQPIRTGDRVMVLPKDDFDLSGLLAAAKAHSWPGHPGQPKPFDSVDEARECARPFRLLVSA